MEFWLWLTLGFGLGGQRHRDALALVLEENRILRERLRGMLGGKHLLLRDEERKRLEQVGLGALSCIIPDPFGLSPR